jgi:hypothetical protein
MSRKPDNTARDNRILELRAQGKSQSKIADELKLEFNLVRSVIRRAKKRQAPAEDSGPQSEPAAQEVPEATATEGTTSTEATPMSKVVLLLLDDITVDPELQPREHMDEATIAEYRQALDDGDTLPPGIVFYDGERNWLADGFHRREAHRRAGRTAMPVEIRAGTRRDALLFAASANATHGLKRRDEDKDRQVLMLLRDAEWQGWSDREIARHCRVSPTHVGKLRREEESRASSLSTVDSEDGAGRPGAKATERTYTTRHGTKAKMRVGRIGKKNKARAEQNEPVEHASEPPAPEQQQAELPFAEGSTHSTPSPYPQAAPAAASPLHERLAALRDARTRLDQMLAAPPATGPEGVLDVLEAIQEEHDALSKLHEERWGQLVGAPESACG